MENFEKNKNKEKIVKEIVKEELPLDDGTILELHFDKDDDKRKRIFIKDKEGKILKFIDLDLDDIDLLKEYNLDRIKNKALKAGIVLKDDELAKISDLLNKKIIDSVFVELDEGINEDEDIKINKWRLYIPFFII